MVWVSRRKFSTTQKGVRNVGYKERNRVERLVARLNQFRRGRFGGEIEPQGGLWLPQER